MFKKKRFIVFEGIEGSGKSSHSLHLLKKLKSLRVPCVYLREPGGSSESENIRDFLLKHDNRNFKPLTDTLLYLAARNENFISKIKPFYKKKVIICDRFIDSTLAYQHYGLGVKKDIINYINKQIIGNIKPDYTFLMHLEVNSSILRISNRKITNRYDKFKKSFYKRVQRGFVKISKQNKSKYMIVDSLNDFNQNKKLFLIKLKV